MRRAIVAVILEVRNDHGVVGQAVVLNVSGQVVEGDHIAGLGAVVDDIGKVGKWVVVPSIGHDGSAQVSRMRQAFRVHLPGLACFGDSAHNIIRGYSAGELVIGGDQVAHGQHEIVGERVETVGEILGGQPVPLRQLVGIWHGRIADYLAIRMVLLDQHKHVRYKRNFACTVGVGIPPSSAATAGDQNQSGQGAGQESFVNCATSPHGKD